MYTMSMVFTALGLLGNTLIIATSPNWVTAKTAIHLPEEIRDISISTSGSVVCLKTREAYYIHHVAPGVTRRIYRSSKISGGYFSISPNERVIAFWEQGNHSRATPIVKAYDIFLRKFIFIQKLNYFRTHPSLRMQGPIVFSPDSKFVAWLDCIDDKGIGGQYWLRILNLQTGQIRAVTKWASQMGHLFKKQGESLHSYYILDWSIDLGIVISAGSEERSGKHLYLNSGDLRISPSMGSLLSYKRYDIAKSIFHQPKYTLIVHGRDITIDKGGKIRLVARMQVDLDNGDDGADIKFAPKPQWVIYSGFKSEPSTTRITERKTFQIWLMELKTGKQHLLLKATKKISNIVNHTPSVLQSISTNGCVYGYVTDIQSLRTANIWRLSPNDGNR